MFVTSAVAASLVEMKADLDVLAAQGRHFPQSVDFLQLLVLGLVFLRLRQKELFASVLLRHQALW